MVCWWCHWGWPKQIRDIYDNALAELGGDDSALKDGPAHVVWCDENFDFAEWCLSVFDEWVKKNNNGRFSDQQMDVVRQSLTELLSVPDCHKCEPEGYDGENPADYPPPQDWVMVKD